MTAMLHEFVRQGYSEAVAFAMAKEAAGGDHGDAMAALWRMRKLAKWEAARWMMTGVVAMLIFNALCTTIQHLVTFVLSRKQGISMGSDYQFSMLMHASITLVLGLVLTWGGCADIRKPVSWFLKFWRWLPRQLGVTAITVALVEIFVGWLFGSMSFHLPVWIFGVAGFCFLINFQIKNLQRGFLTQRRFHPVASPPSPLAWKLMLMGVLLIQLMSYSSKAGMVILLAFLGELGYKWYFSIHSLLHCLSTICLGCLLWFILDVPLIRRLAKWWLHRPWRSLLLCFFLCAVVPYLYAIIRQIARGTTLGRSGLFGWFLILSILSIIVFPISLVLWMKSSAKRDSRELRGLKGGGNALLRVTGGGKIGDATQRVTTGDHVDDQ